MQILRNILITRIELIAGSKTDDLGVKNAMMKALQEVVGKAGSNMSEVSRNAILGLIDDDASDQTGMASCCSRQQNPS